jgi:hypothetical protein
VAYAGFMISLYAPNNTVSSATMGLAGDTSPGTCNSSAAPSLTGPITGVSYSGTDVTITTTTAAVPTNQVVISGLTGGLAVINGTWKVTTATTGSFHITIDTTPSGSYSSGGQVVTIPSSVIHTNFTDCSGSPLPSQDLSTTAQSQTITLAATGLNSPTATTANLLSCGVAQATDATSADTGVIYSGSVPITGVSYSGTHVTITAPVAVSPGQYITVSSVGGITGVDGTWMVVSLGVGSFNITTSSTPSGTYTANTGLVSSASDVTYGSAGPFNQPSTAMTFSGTGGYVGTTQGYTYTTGGSGAVSGWFRAPSTGYSAPIVSLTNVQSDDSTALVDTGPSVWLNSTGHVMFATTTTQLTSASTYADGSWHFFAASWGPAGQQLITDNATPVTDSSTASPNFTGYWHIGYGPDTTQPTNPSSSDYFHGDLAAVTLYNSQALTSSSIAATLYSARTAGDAAHYATTIASQSTVPVSYWPLDDTGSLSYAGTLPGYTTTFASVAATGTTVTVTTTDPNPQLVPGQQITISGVTGTGTLPSLTNGTQTITAVSSSSITFTAASAPTGAATPATGSLTTATTPTTPTVLQDHSGNANPATAQSGLSVPTSSTWTPSAGVPFAGPLTDSTAVYNNGTSGSGATTANPDPSSATSPSTQTAYFKVSSGYANGGVLMSLSSDQSNANVSPALGGDHQVWLDDSGHVVFGIAQGTSGTGTRTEISSAATSHTYNDGSWHQVVASVGPLGMVLTVDGTQVANNATVTSGFTYSSPGAYWHLGYGYASTWADAPTDSYLNGWLADAAVVPAQLNHTTAASLYTPTTSAALANAIAALTPTAGNYYFWPLNDSSPTTANPLCANVALTIQVTTGSTTTCVYPAGSGACPAPSSSALLSDFTNRSIPIPTLPRTTTTVTITTQALTTPGPGFAGLHLMPDFAFATSTSDLQWAAGINYPYAYQKL